MGNPKQKWTAEEEEALRKGIDKHGAGKWKNIQIDPEFNHLLYSRSNIDLKDKWRNLSVSATGQGSREKSRTPKPKPDPDVPTPITPMPIGISPVPAPPVKKEAQDDKSASDVKKAPPFNNWILDAISDLKDPNGSDTGAIVGYIKEKHELPVNFKRMLSTRLNRLVAQDKIEKDGKTKPDFRKEFSLHHYLGKTIPIGNYRSSKQWHQKGPKGYRMKNSVIVLPRPKPPISVPVVLKPIPVPVPTPIHNDTLEEAASDAAYRIAEAENKSFVASEAVKEAEKVSKLAEDCESVLFLAKEIFERCSRGEIVLMG